MSNSPEVLTIFVVENLKDAFAGESMANRRYLFFAQRADIEGYNGASSNSSIHHIPSFISSCTFARDQTAVYRQIFQSLSPCSFKTTLLLRQC